MNEYQKYYEEILDSSQKIRKAAVAEWGDVLMFGGEMPKEVSSELSVVAQITGVIFDAFANHGINMAPVEGKRGFYSLTIGEKEFICHESAIPSLNGGSAHSPAVIAPSVQEEGPVLEPRSFEPENSSASNAQNAEEAEIGDKLQVEPAYGTDAELLLDEDAAGAGLLLDENEGAETDDDAELLLDDEPLESVSLPGEGDVTKSDEENDPEPIFKGAQIIGGEANFGSLTKEDLFLEEKSKNASDMLYELFTITMTHSGFAGGGRPEEFRVMVAPLKTSAFAISSVPIIASFYNRGKVVTASSYDNKEDSQNIITVCVGDFYFLVRGTYDGSGKFKAFITTTGPSANQGDIMNIVSHRQFGLDAKAGVGNGHIKFRISINEAPGVLEVFPFGEPGERDFVVLSKTDEFTDYTFISESAKALNKMIIYEHGVKKKLVCLWENEVLSADLVEV